MANSPSTDAISCLAFGLQTIVAMVEGVRPAGSGASEAASPDGTAKQMVTTSASVNSAPRTRP